MGRDRALDLLARSKVVHIATTNDVGEPILRTVHGVVVGSMVMFHGASAGEKLFALGRSAVVSAEQIIAEIPSYFLDPERACPATTLYLSAQVHGVLQRIDDRSVKAMMLSALMTKYQPEGGHAPIAVDHPEFSRLYQQAVEAILVVGVALENLDGKAKLAQNRKPEERLRLLEHLWRRGAETDPAAIDFIRQANCDRLTPAFLDSPKGTTLVCALQPVDAPAAAALVRDAYWNADVAFQTLVHCHARSSAWVGARDESGALIATARAISDGAKHAWIYDVMISPTHRSQGLGKCVLRLLLDHPALRFVQHARLATRDAQAFYHPFGFIEEAALPKKSYTSTTMVRRLTPA
ncbi:MAG: hypothetical protein NVS3B20_13940 [Polyangiales bacterium]